MHRESMRGAYAVMKRGGLRCGLLGGIDSALQAGNTGDTQPPASLEGSNLLPRKRVRPWKPEANEVQPKPLASTSKLG